MNIHTIAAGSAAAPARKHRRPKSVRPRFKVSQVATPCIMHPPAVGGETFAYCPDWDEAMAARYAQEGHPLAMLVRLRLEAARHVEALLAFLDATEGDIDFGADDAEPTLQAIREAASLCNDGTDDDEDGADGEPWLASPEPLTTYEDEFWFPYRSQDARQDIPQGVSDDRELDDSDDEPSLCGVTATTIPSHMGVEDGEQEADDEPSLGSIEGPSDPRVGAKSMGQQERWSQGSSSFDLELDDADDEDGADSEPSLGSVNSWGGCQSLWAEGAPVFDLEDEHDGAEPEASGIADVDGLIEQGDMNLRFNTKLREILADAVQREGEWYGHRH